MPLRVAIVDDEPVVCKRLSQALVKEGYAVEAFMSARSFLEAMIEQPFDVVFSDMLLPDMNGLELLPKIKGLKPETEVIIVTGHGTISTAIEAMREGAFHYVTKPVNFTEIRTLARHAQEKIAMRMENTRLREALLGTTGLSSIVGKSPAIQELFSLIRKVAPVDCNVLVQGDSGTGKSATVKSLLSLPGFEDLRLIEVQKEELGGMPELIRTLAGRRRKFILFIDDLAFDQDDRTYSVLKTILEGGLERRPSNVAVYATSNRRHLVRQTFSDRAGDEVDASETIQEKTSLSDRFGLRIPYLALNKIEFLALVDRMAEQAGIASGGEALHAAALRWEMRHPGRTPRTAKQFIASLSL